MKWPRILYVGHDTIDARNATGLLLRNLLADCPEGRLLQVVISDASGPSGSSVVRVPTPTRAIIRARNRRHASRLRAQNALEESPTSAPPPPAAAPVGMESRAKSALDMVPIRVSPALRLATQEFQPDVIYSLFSTIRSMRLGLALSRETGAPIVPHFMDDWPGTLYTRDKALVPARHALCSNLSKVIERSPVCLAIGEKMAHEYERLVDRQFDVVGPGADSCEFERSHPAAQGVCQRLVFVGGLHAGRAELLQKVAGELQRGTQTERPWCLHTYVPPSQVDHLRPTETLKVHDWGPPSSSPRTLVSADALLHVEPFDAPLAAFFKLSVSAKTPQYVFAQRPVLALAPPSSGSVDALARAGVLAGWATSPTGSAVREAIERLEATPALGPIEDNVRDIFDLSANQRRFAMAIRRAAHGAAT